MHNTVLWYLNLNIKDNIEILLQPCFFPPQYYIYNTHVDISAVMHYNSLCITNINVIYNICNIIAIHYSLLMHL